MKKNIINLQWHFIIIFLLLTVKYPLRNSMTSSTWTKLWTLTRTRVEFWQWRDAPILWTSFTLSGTEHTSSSLREGVLNLPRSYWNDLCPWFAFSPVPDYVKATVETVMKIHETEDDGDVLAFLTGQVRGYVLNITQQLSTVSCLQKESRPGWSFFSSSSWCCVCFLPGRGGESGFPPAGAGQDSVPIWHEETPQNPADVLRSSLRRSDEGLWEGALLCSQGE